MTQPKSPFLIFQNFLRPDECDKYQEAVRIEPILDDQGKPMPSDRHHESTEETLFEKLKLLIPQIERHFELKYRGTEHMIFQQFPPSGKQDDKPHCENSVYKRKKWIKVRDRDLTGVIWLKDFHDQPPFNIKTQVYGGKLEFPIYNFGFQPQRGTLVIYPAGPHFIALTTPVMVGELQLVRINIAAEGIWLYQPDRFPGDFRVWFNDVV